MGSIATVVTSVARGEAIVVVATIVVVAQMGQFSVNTAMAQCAVVTPLQIFVVSDVHRVHVSTQRTGIISL